MTPTFAPAVCLLAPGYLTGDSVRDKCVEMLSAALKAEDDYKDYGVNCDKMASEIEDHILELCPIPVQVRGEEQMVLGLLGLQGVAPHLSVPLHEWLAGP
ncbi:hypothetical protein GH733_015719 [Mirounga leonina]|nr:hypothetical protein GH733_015719 [Mirounga leonina]